MNKMRKNLVKIRSCVVISWEKGNKYANPTLRCTLMNMSKLVVPLHCFWLELETTGLRVRCADPRSRCLLYYELIFVQALSSLEERFSLSLARYRKGLGNGISYFYRLDEGNLENSGFWNSLLSSRKVLWSLFFFFSVGDLKFLPLSLGFISVYTPIMKGGSLRIFHIRLLDTFVTLIIFLLYLVHFQYCLYTWYKTYANQKRFPK